MNKKRKRKRKGKKKTMTNPKEKPQQAKHDHPGRKSGQQRKMNLTPEESEKILKRVFLGEEDEESKNKKD